MYEAIVVGAGPAGVSCALWLKQLGFSPVLVDRNEVCGGLQLLNSYSNTWIATSVDAHGKDIAQALHSNMVRHKVAMHLGVTALSAMKSDSAWLVQLSSGLNLQAKFLVLASGTSPKRGGFVGRIGMILGPGPGVANTDFVGARVAILGGGDSAFENYSFVKARGAKDVSIFARSIRARADLLRKAPASDVRVGDYEVDEEARVVNGHHFDHIIVLYGYEANSSSLLGLNPGLSPDGFVVTDAACETSIPSVFAIGEIARRAHPCCVTAMADGVTAAKEIQRRCEAEFTASFVGLARRSMSLVRNVVSQ